MVHSILKEKADIFKRQLRQKAPHVTFSLETFLKRLLSPTIRRIRHFCPSSNLCERLIGKSANVFVKLRHKPPLWGPEPYEIPPNHLLPFPTYSTHPVRVRLPDLECKYPDYLYKVAKRMLHIFLFFCPMANGMFGNPDFY